MDARFEQARAFFQQGLAAYQAGHWPEAERAFDAALSLAPGRPSVLTNLGATRLKLGRFEDAAGLLEEAVAQEADNGEAWGHLATARAECGRTHHALDAARRATALLPDAAATWTLRGALERELGLLADARTSFEHALARGADPGLVGYYLAAVAQAGTPPAPPRQYVEELFDHYQDSFEEHLVGTLGYRAPELLAQGLARPRYAAALDLGCGTGLCAPLLRPRCDRLDGVDLSARMADHARARGLYDEVVHADLAEHLAATGRRYDLLVAADVFIYVGALEAVFAAAARVLPPGGEFCFSVEAHNGDAGFVLRPSLRYAHSERYIRSLAGLHGFELRATARHPLRIDQGQPIAGLFTWLTRRGTPA